MIVDLALSDSEGLDTFTQIYQKTTVPIIVIVSPENEALGQQAVLQGAYDYLIKEISHPREFHRTIRHVIEKYELLKRFTKNEGEQFRHIVEKSIQGQVVVNLKKIVCYANQASANILEIPIHQMSGHPFPYAITPNKITELNIPLASGETKIVETHVTEITWDGHPAYLIVLHDVTRSEVIEHLKAEIIQSKKLDRLKDEFVSAISHELRTPLTIIKGAIDNLKDGVAGPLQENQAKMITIAHTNSSRLVKIINNLLDLSRLESGHSHFNRSPIKITPLIQEVMRNFQVILKEKGISLKAQIPVDLPEIYADPDMVVQALNNLLDNALRYARSQISLTILKPEDKLRKNVEVIITDDGPGIPVDQRDRLFSKFVQINRPAGGAGYKGTGLGLAICREIATLHHGEIWVDEGKEGGCRFHITFPIFNALLTDTTFKNSGVPMPS